MGKLIADRTPHVLATEPLRLTFTQADPDQRRHLLLTKLLEETGEWLLASGDAELAARELADLQQVLWALAHLDGLSAEDLLDAAEAHGLEDPPQGREALAARMLTLAGQWLTGSDAEQITATLGSMQQLAWALCSHDQVAAEFVLGAAMLKQQGRGSYDTLTVMSVDRDDSPAAAAERTLPIWATKPPGWTAPPPTPEPDPPPEPDPTPEPPPAATSQHTYRHFGGAGYSG